MVPPGHALAVMAVLGGVWGLGFRGGRKVKAPPPVASVMPRTATDQDAESTIRTLDYGHAVETKRVMPAEECDVTYDLDDDDTALVFSRNDVYKYSCNQTFRVLNPGSTLSVACHQLQLKGNCFFESLRVTVDGNETAYCRSDPVPAMEGRVVSVEYTRRLLGFHGGFACTVTSVGDSVDPPPSAHLETAGQVGVRCQMCGVTAEMEARDNSHHRIVGGVDTTRGQWPWQVLVKVRTTSGLEFRCGGSIISDRAIVTAAHCLHDLEIQFVEIVGGITQLSAPLDHNTATRRTTTFVMHADYDPGNVFNDVALVTLEDPLDFSSTIRPICLPSVDLAFGGARAMATGWGTTEYNGYQADVLQEVELEVWSQDRCQGAWDSNFGEGRVRVLSTQVCAGENGKDTCSGDSGGPLVVEVGERYELLGITSYGFECASPGLPGVYTRVSKFNQWIRDFLPNSTCSLQ